jgi:uncharacterized membrane protein SpoIIM required for sporulation
MKEIIFLKQNAKKWHEFEQLIRNKQKVDPDLVAELYIQIVSDLSYAQTFYPKSKTVQYLAGLATQYHQIIYRNKKEHKGRLLSFWKDEQPRLIGSHHKEMFVACVIFISAIFIGVLSSAYDKSFVRLIMGDSYVKMTLENIKKGDPMAVYKTMHEVPMFLGITFNNIRVAIFAFIAGITCSFGTGLILFQNGVMLGAFHYFFYERGLLGISLSTIWIHGTLEISAILIASSAGIVMGNSILFPGTYSRAQSFVKGAKQGLKIVIGVIPLFFVAGFLEGFVTRYTEMPFIISLIIIMCSFVFVVWFYIINPIRLKGVLHDAE